MEITSTPFQSTAPTQSSANSKISSDFDTFLKMLTAQIQNQDPLNPIDSADYAVQLATFSSVEQQTLTNKKLDALAGLMGAQGLAQLAPWVGQEARSAAPVFMDGTPVTLSPNAETGADRAILVVKDSAGSTVSREDIPVQATSYSWTGKDITGAALPNGTYSLSLESYSDDVQISATPVEHYARIQEVQTSPTGPRFILTGGVSLSAEEITALRSLN
ncbi:flagellar hook capping FlgD N-terminal domain-containing protein [Pseudorhodobacter ferrugineus]|uniref:flagellar hook capping FlgD N-terminal domain-containing protein n=1 Tax=Pseudorhodobacter ferrugineus TaxID=77008 RepID=UPI0003B55499|nr:flagellar hook capping FlgD N-terminal domain-containing protein [Pseudorhodobacter ferrugineus]